MPGTCAWLTHPGSLYRMVAQFMQPSNGPGAEPVRRLKPQKQSPSSKNWGRPEAELVKADWEYQPAPFCRSRQPIKACRPLPLS